MANRPVLQIAILLSAVWFGSCDINGDSTITISGTPAWMEEVTAVVTGKTYGDIEWLFSPDTTFTGPTMQFQVRAKS